MRVINSIKDMKYWVKQQKKTGSSIGFIPTMGALHEGHTSLIDRAKKKSKKIVVSIFVNPTQFDDASDFKAYPNNLKSDQEILRDHNVDILFLPQEEDIYQDNYRFQVRENELSQKFCGAHRPGHFDGVLTVVMKLLNIVSPSRAYFGEKDFQQLSLVRDMVSAFFLDCEIVGCPTVREASGLAKSSRNLRLSDEQMIVAPKMYEIICSAKSAEDAREQLIKLGFDVDYVSDWKGRRLVAASCGNVRLIDNVCL